MFGRSIWLSAIVAAPFFLGFAWADDTQPVQAPSPPKPDFAVSDARWVYDTTSNCWARDDVNPAQANFSWTGACTSQRITGPGTLKWSLNGFEDCTITGTFVDGVLNGEGDEEWTNGVHYHGAFREGVFGGSGEESWPNGDHYIGQFADGKLEGQGRLTAIHGVHFDGTFKNGLIFDGSGYIEYAKDTFYEGAVKNGMREGQGVLRFPGGSYEGGFHNALFEGKGTYNAPDGSHYVGEFSDGVLTGQGTVTFMGNVYEGEFRHSEMSGQGVLHRPDGSTLKGIAEPPRANSEKPSDPIQYPPISRRLAEQGAVIVAYTIGADGEVSDMKVVKSSGYQRLDDAAIASAQTLHYIPQKIGGVAIAIRKDRNYKFHLAPPP